MRRNRLGTIAAAAACLGMVLPPTAHAAEPSFSGDVALRSGGVLVGQVVDQQGAAKAGTLVSIQYGEHEVVRATTDENGFFAAQGLRGGQYQLLTDDGSSVYRLWAADTAPPFASPAALIVSGNDVVRGQPGCGDGVSPHCAQPVSHHGPMHSWVDWMKGHPYIVAGTVAAAIAIPLAMVDRRPSS